MFLQGNFKKLPFPPQNQYISAPVFLCCYGSADGSNTTSYPFSIKAAKVRWVAEDRNTNPVLWSSWIVKKAYCPIPTFACRYITYSLQFNAFQSETLNNNLIQRHVIPAKPNKRPVTSKNWSNYRLWRNLFISAIDFHLFQKLLKTQSNTLISCYHSHFITINKVWGSSFGLQ